MSRRPQQLCLVLVFAVACSINLTAAVAPPIPEAAQASPHFDALAATNAWLNTVPAAARARSDAYFEGGYWLILWDFLAMAAVMILLLETGLSARLRNVALRITRHDWLQAFLYWLQFAVITAVLLLPLNLYEGFFREHSYGLSNQSALAWLRDAGMGFAVAAVLGGVVASALLVLRKRLPRTWHLWGTAVAVAFIIFAAAIAPVLLMPLFNKYTPLKDSALKQQILSLARANGIPAHDVYEADASRQSKRVSANVSGLFGTDQITLNDNLLARCSPGAVLSTMGHEMGHYVMHHIENGVLFGAVVIFVMFLLVRTMLTWAEVRWGARWQLSGNGDFASLPLAVLIFLAINFLLTPVQNSYTRMQEYEADIFGLDTARQPDGEAEIDLLLGEYRKLDPSPLEEIIFFDHPSGRTRIYAAMRWKAENLCLFDPSLACTNRPAALPKPVPSGLIRPRAAPLQ